MDLPKTDKSDKDDAPKDGKIQALRQNSLKAAGVGYLLADAALFTSGVMSGKLKEASAGVFGWIAGVIGARYGNPKAEKKLEQIERRLGTYLRKQGVEIPKDPTTESLTNEGGVIDNIESFLYTYPSQMMNVFYSLIGVQFVRSALQHNKKELLASGGLLIAGALAGILIPEKKPDPEHPPQGVLQKTWSWIQEKPLRLTGTLFTLNQVTLAMDALQERRQNPAQKSYMFKLLAVAGFVFGNTMMSLSSKSHGGGSKMDEKTLCMLAETSAKVIAAQSPEVQNGLLEHIAGFLATQPNVYMTAEEISKILHAKMNEVAKLPTPSNWLERMRSTPPLNLQQSI